jgi:integrase
MASLHARHSRRCGLGPRVLSASGRKPDGCTCRPTYCIAVRKGARTEWINVGRDKREAQDELAKIEAAVRGGTHRPQRNITFEAWADEWLAALQRPKPTTVRDYRATMGYAKTVFGQKRVRDVTPGDLSEFLRRLPQLTNRSRKPNENGDREPMMSQSTRAKHLRHLHACFKVAVKSGYAGRNPVEDLDDSLRPRAEGNVISYFDDGELAALAAQYGDDVYGMHFRLAVRTGLRLGELSALRWGNVNLTEGYIHVAESFTHYRLGQPKSRTSIRNVYIDPDTVDMLGAWYGACGKPDDSKLVLPAPSKSGFLDPKDVAARLAAAMAAAGVPEYDAQGRRRKQHSLRHTYARIVLEQGQSLYWLQGQLGHSSYKVTEQAYADISPKHRQAVAEQLRGAFSV